MPMPVRVFGRASDLIAANAPMDVYDMGRIFPFLSEPKTLFVSSSNAADVIPIYVHGLGPNFESQGFLVILNGQNPVQISGLWRRVFFAQNADSGTPFQGDIYIAETGALTDGVPDDLDTIQAKVGADLQMSANGFATIPKGYRGEIQAISSSVVPKSSQAVNAKLGIFVRNKNNTFTCQAFWGLMTTGTSFMNVPIKAMNRDLVEFDDVVFRILSLSSNDTEITVQMELKLVEI